MRYSYVTGMWYNARQSRRKYAQTGKAVANAPEVGYVYDTPEVYKLPMVRMSIMTDEIPNVRV